MGLFGDGGAKEAGRAAKAISSIPVPNLSDLIVQLEEYVRQGEITPDQAMTFLQNPSAFASIQEDPQLRATQLGALAEYGDIYNEGGMDARSRADLYNIGAQQQTENRGQQDAILANARARGVGGSNLEFASRLVAQQGTANRAAASGVNAAANAQQRRDAALGNQAQLASSIRGQDYDRSSDAARAADEISRFNTQMSQSQANRAVDDRNRAQAINLGAKQGIADANVDTRNRQEQINKGLPLDIFNARLGKATQAGNAGLRAGQLESEDKNSTLSTIGSIASLAALAFSDEELKEDIRPIDSASILDDIGSYSFNYKDEAHGEGRKTGVLAQDLERAGLGGAVEDTSQGKVVDYGQLGGTLMSLLADVSNRLEKVEGKRNA